MPTALDKSYGLVTEAVRKNQEAQASALAAKMAADDDLGKAFHNAVVHANENKKSVVAIHFSLLDLFDEDEIKTWPVPGSLRKDVGDNEPFDRYEYKDSNGNMKKDSYWTNVARSHPEGVAILERKQRITDGYDGKTTNEWTGVSEGDMKRAKADVEADFTTFQSKLRLAVQAYFHQEEMRERCPAVTVGYAMTAVMEGGKVKIDPATKKPVMAIDRSSPAIIRIGDAVDNAKAKYFTIPNFLRLDIQHAVDHGGSYTDVITANKREKPDDQPGTTATEFPKLDTNVKFELATIAMVDRLNVAFNTVPGTKDLLGFYRAAGSDARLQTVFDLAEKLSVITESPEFKARYEAMVSGTEKPDQKKAA